MKGRLEVLDKETNINNNNYDNLEIDFQNLLQRTDLKKELSYLKIDLALLKEIISEQKELDYESTNLETNGDKQAMLKTLQQKLNKRDVYIDKLDTFLSQAIKLEEELLIEDDSSNETEIKSEKVEKLTEWNQILKRFVHAIDDLKKEYHESIKKEMTNEWKYTMKYLVMSKGSSHSEFIEKPRVKMLRCLDFKVEKVEKKMIEYEVTCFKKRFKLLYTGYLIDGEKEGFGILHHTNGHLFYEGEFRDDEIFGNFLKIYYENGKPLLNVNCEVDCFLDRADGD